MNVFKKIILILSLFCVTFPVFGMDSNDSNQGFFGWLWDTAREHPVATAAGATLFAGAGLLAYRLQLLHQQPVEQHNARLPLRENNPRVDDLNLLLFHAMDNNLIDEVQRLLANGIDVNVVYRDYTPLHRACRNGSVQLVTLLLEMGANIEAKGLAGRTPLHEAARAGQASIVKLLLDAGANVEARDNVLWSPLFMAARAGHASIVKLLLDAGASLEVNAEDVYFMGTPLSAAAYAGHVEVVRAILHYIPNQTIKKNRSHAQQRTVAILCAFKKLRPLLPNDVRKRILSYLPEDIISQDHAKILYDYTTNKHKFINDCPFACLVELYKNIAPEQKEQFLERVAHALAENRLCRIQEWLKDKNILELDPAHLNPEIITMLDPDTIEQHRKAIEENVRMAFLNAESVVQDNAGNNNTI